MGLGDRELSPSCRSNRLARGSGLFAYRCLCALAVLVACGCGAQPGSQAGALRRPDLRPWLADALLPPLATSRVSESLQAPSGPVGPGASEPVPPRKALEDAGPASEARPQPGESDPAAAEGRALAQSSRGAETQPAPRSEPEAETLLVDRLPIGACPAGSSSPVPYPSSPESRGSDSTVTGPGTQVRPERPESPRPPAARALSAHTCAPTGGDYDAAPSPDGTWFVFASTRSSREPELFRQDFSGGAAVRLTFPPAEGPAISRSGPSGLGGRIQPAASPDGSEIAFAAADAGSWDIWVMPSQGGPMENLTSTPDLDELHPTWHPSGAFLAFNVRGPGPGEWWICTKPRGRPAGRSPLVPEGASGPAGLSGRTASRKRPSATSRIAPGLAPSWSPAGDRIAFQRADPSGEGRYALWSVEVRVSDDGLVSPGAEFCILSKSGLSAVEPAFGPDGEWLAFVAVTPVAREGAGPVEERERTPPGSDIWCVRADGTGLVRLTETPEPEYGPAWAAGGHAGAGEGGRIFFTSERGGRASIWSLLPGLAGSAQGSAPPR